MSRPIICDGCGVESAAEGRGKKVWSFKWAFADTGPYTRDFCQSCYNELSVLIRDFKLSPPGLPKRRWRK